MKIKLTVNIFCFFITIHNVFFIRTYKELYIGNHSELDTRLYEFFISQWPMLSPPKIFTLPPESPCITAPTRNPTSIMPCLHVPHRRAWRLSRRCTHPDHSRYVAISDNTSLGNAYMHTIFCRTVLATCRVLLSLERSGSVAQRCMGLIERKHGILLLLPSTVYQHCYTTCREHNCPVLYIFQSLFGLKSLQVQSTTPFSPYITLGYVTNVLRMRNALHLNLVVFRTGYVFQTPAVAKLIKISSQFMIPMVHKLGWRAFWARRIQHGL